MKINLLERKKVSIEGFGAHLFDPERCLVAYTTAGVLVLKNHPDFPKWYCTQDGRFFHLTKNGNHLNEMKAKFGPSGTRSCVHMHGRYPCLTRLSDRTLSTMDCHRFMWEVWKGPRTQGMQIDHVNGNKLDWRLCNLEEVTPAENRKRALMLREMRRNGIEPTDCTTEHLRKIFNSIRVIPNP